MKFGNIFWGVILIFLGILFILQNLGIIDFQWTHLWRLWPVILILWGISILPAHSLIKSLLVVVVLAGAVYFMVDRAIYWEDRTWTDRFHRWDDWDDDESKPIDQTFHIPYEDSIPNAYLDLDLAAGSFVLDETSDYLLDFNKRGSWGKYSYVIKKLDDKTEVYIERDDVNIKKGKGKHNVNISLNEFPVWELNMDVGASAVDLDLTDYKVKELDVDGGAAAFDIRLGDAYPELYVNIDAGASSIELEIPETSGCELNISSVLSGKSIKGFEKIDHGHYKTENFDTAQNRVFIKLDAAVSSYSITRY
jgi:hypothetical protein